MSIMTLSVSLLHPDLVYKPHALFPSSFLNAVQAQIAQARQHQPPPGEDGQTEWTGQEQGLCVCAVCDTL